MGIVNKDMNYYRKKLNQQLKDKALEGLEHLPEDVKKKILKQSARYLVEVFSNIDMNGDPIIGKKK